MTLYRYAVSYLHGRDEAWVSRFLGELQSRLDAVDGTGFARITPPNGRKGGPDTESYGVGTADVVLALCSPAYFSEGPADHDWAVLVYRRSLGQARTGTAPQTVLPLIWEPIDQRLPEPVAVADTFTAGQPPEYRSLGLALMTMQAPRYRRALDAVLSGIVAHLVAAVEGVAPAPRYENRPAHELPRGLGADDLSFTEQFRKELAPYATAPLSRLLRVPGDGGTQETVPGERLPELGRRFLLVGPAGSGRSTELAGLAARILGENEQAPGRSGLVPWGCRVPFLLSAASGALPPLDGLAAALAPAVSRQEPAGWAARQLRAGQAFVAVDDLDSVPARNRAATWESVLRLLHAHPQAPCVIVTNGTEVPWERLDGLFRIAFLQPLDPPGVRTLLGSLAGSGAGDQRVSELLVRHLERDPVLGGIAGRPAAAAAIWRTARGHGHGDGHDDGDDDGPAPEGLPPRLQLLRSGISAVWRRDPVDGAPPTSAVRDGTDQVPDSVLRAAAGGLAVATLGLDSSAVPLRTALTALGKQQVAGASGATSPERLLAALADVAGMLFGTGPGSVAFPDPAVRTFLAAHHLAVVRDVDAEHLVAQQHSPELVELVRRLRTAEVRSGPGRDGLTVLDRPLRRLVAARRTAVEPPPAPAVVRSRAELRALVGRVEVPELRCEGPVDGLEEFLHRLPGLRALVLADNPRLTSLPRLTGCRSLRSLRVLRCPALRDLAALESSTVMFLTVAPWPPRLGHESLYRTPWLSRVELEASGASGEQPPGLPEVSAALPEIRVRAGCPD